MIPIMRGDEPPELGIVRQTKLEQLRNLGRAIVSDDIDGYRVVSCQLWKVQHFKCCYCEHKVTMRYNDVEHYRPKARADRRPGCTRPDGYWWLAYSWQNLLYACATCNRSSKNDSFPLEIGSVSLVAETVPPGRTPPTSRSSFPNKPGGPHTICARHDRRVAERKLLVGSAARC